MICELQYIVQEKKRLEFLALERELAEDKERQALLLAGASANQNKLLQIVSQVLKSTVLQS